MTLAIIYERLKNKVQSLLGVSVTKYSFIDQLLYACSDSLNEAYTEIEKNKTPHIYTSLSGERIDGLGVLVGCYRYENESDKSYLARVMAHHKTHAASNATAIEMMLAELKYSSHASYTPFTQGTGTATIHFIPVFYDDATIEKAIGEIKARLKQVVSPDSYIKVQVAIPISVKIFAYAQLDGQNEFITTQLQEKIKKYVNGIPIGNTLSYGMINRIGLSETGVSYFNTIGIYLDEKKMEDLEMMQTIQNKFLFDQFTIEEVKN